MSKKFFYKTHLCALFASFATILVGTASLLENGAIDYYSVIGALTKILPAAAMMALLGWCIGAIIDKPKTKINTDYNNPLLNELLKNENFEFSDEFENELSEEVNNE